MATFPPNVSVFYHDINVLKKRRRGKFGLSKRHKSCIGLCPVGPARRPWRRPDGRAPIIAFPLDSLILSRRVGRPDKSVQNRPIPDMAVSEVQIIARRHSGRAQQIGHRFRRERYQWLGNAACDNSAEPGKEWRRRRKIDDL